MKITAILASHNRREQTLACLEAFFAQDVGNSTELRAVLVDGGSRDGTVEAVRKRFPQIDVKAEGPDLFWAGAMAIGERHALAEDPNYLLWLNDDVVLDAGALRTLLDIAEEVTGLVIVIGAVRDPDTGVVTYSGVERTGWHPLRMRWIQPTDRPIEVETFNGNMVLVSRAVQDEVGPLDGRLVHSAADFDYGLRARKAGVRNLLAPGTLGTCRRDGELAPWLNQSLSLRARLNHLLGPKGAPPLPRARYLKRHGGPIWPIFWLSPYLTALCHYAWPKRPSSPR